MAICFYDLMVKSNNNRTNILRENVVLVYAPFCTPSVPPYSITNIYSFLKNNLANIKNKSAKDVELSILDLNIEFYKKNFPEYQNFCRNISNDTDFNEYNRKTNEYKVASIKSISLNNKKIVGGESPEKFDYLLNKILIKKPTIVAFSLVYSSQVFYTFKLIEELKKKGIKCVVGGPAVNDKLKKAADESLDSAFSLLRYIENENNHKSKINDEELNKYNYSKTLDYSLFSISDYFNKALVVPLMTSSTCYYKQCSFCTHHGNKEYFEYDLDDIEDTIKNLESNYIFLIDDMIHKKRILDLAKIFKKYDKKWMAQLRPTKEFDETTLGILYNSGLKCVIWGVESGVDRILKLMNKGTNSRDVTKLLQYSRNAGIKNIVYMMFGFPTETKDEFLQSIEFLKSSSDNIDLISTSIFGLQRGSLIYDKPEKYGIIEIIEKKRTFLDPQISFVTKSGQTTEQASKLLKKHKKTIENINKYPKMMNFFREHMLVLC